MLTLIIATVIGLILTRYFLSRSPAKHAPTGAVVISGSSTGIGYDAAIRLDKIGISVFAGVRSPKDFDTLRSELSPKSTPVFLDVTSDESVSQCLKTVQQKLEESKESLIGVINNAGIADVCPVEGLQVEDVRRLFEVNLFGVIRLNNAFMPLLKKANGRGRIILVGSVWGLASQAFFSSYSMSKFALESLADAMRVEFQYCNIPVQVVLIEPGSFKTAIGSKHKESFQRTMTNLQQPLKEFYQPYLQDLATVVETAEKNLKPPVKVVEAIEEGLLAVNPKVRYLVLPFFLSDPHLYVPSGKIRDWMMVGGLRHVVGQLKNAK